MAMQEITSEAQASSAEYTIWASKVCKLENPVVHVVIINVGRNTYPVVRVQEEARETTEKTYHIM